MIHPKARRPRASGLDRRAFLQGSLALGAGVAGLGALSACGSGDGAPQFGVTDTSAAPYPLARPDNPVTLTISSDNEPIADGLAPETGDTFRILNYADYMNPAIMKAFGKKYDVQVQVTPFNNYDEMLAKLNQPSVYFDMVFPGPSVLGKMVYAQLIQPLNRTYLTHFDNLYGPYQSPWYDVGSQYTVPYTIYTTGVGYRRDRVDSVPANGYDLMWDPKYKGDVYLLDDKGEAIGMSLLRNKITTDINTGNEEYLTQATDSLVELINLVNVKTGIQDYVFLPSGQATVHQAWSGDLLAALQYLPKNTPASVLGYWVPETDFVIGSDNMAIPKSAKKPVLAHLLMDELLSDEGALTNFKWNGYQPPIQSITADSLIADGLIPENLTNAVVRADDFDKGLSFYEVSPAVDALWTDQWSRFQAGG